MNEPLIFKPIVKNNVWGGDFLRCRNADAPAGPLGESWEIADHGEDTTVVASGGFAGKSLHEIYKEVCGQAVDPSSPEVFPLLLKIIDPLSDLSVQVHPDDEYAGRQKAGELGKTEAWYVLEAEPGAKIYRGLKAGVTRDDFAAAIKNGTCADCLKEVPVKAGDVAFLPSGTIHALCGGVRIAEIQQNSDTTYRVFDWNRVGLDGKPRDLHIEDSLNVSDFSGESGADLCEPEKLDTVGCLHEQFVSCEKFAFERISEISGKVVLDTEGVRFNIITVVRGKVEVKCEGGGAELSAYDSCMLPAGCGEYEVTGGADAVALRFYRP